MRNRIILIWAVVATLLFGHSYLKSELERKARPIQAIVDDTLLMMNGTETQVRLELLYGEKESLEDAFERAKRALKGKTVTWAYNQKEQRLELLYYIGRTSLTVTLGLDPWKR